MVFIFDKNRGAAIMVERTGKLKKISAFPAFCRFFLEKWVMIVYDLD
jgi:hypothetical protein